MKGHFSVLISVICLFCFATEAWTKTDSLRLSVAASMTDVFQELSAQFKQRHPEIAIYANYGPSGGLAKQISVGAPADLYISANPKWMDFLAEKQLIALSSRKDIAKNRLVVMGRNGKKLSSLAELVDYTRIGIGSPASVPAGQYARQALERAGVYTQLLDSGKLVMAKDVRQALIFADRGETDLSIVYRSDARLARNATILFTIPESQHDPVSYPLALTVAGAEKKVARLFHAFITSPEIDSVLQTHGFTGAENRP